MRFLRLGPFLVLAGTIVAVLLVISPTLGRAQAAAQQNSAWQVICGDAQKPQTCLIRQRLYPVDKATGKASSRETILVLVVQRAAKPGEKIRKAYLKVLLPLGVDLRRGMVMRVGKGKEIRRNFLRCTARGCEVNFLLDDKMLKLFRSGKSVQFGFAPLGVKKTVVVDASLIGFTKAFNMLK